MLKDKYIFICILFAILLTFTSCQTNGVEKAGSNEIIFDTIYNTDGKIDHILGKRNGKLEGVSKIYYPSGVLKIRKRFVNDTVRGIIENFYENGSLQKFAYAIDNQNNIYFRRYDSKGNILEKGGTPFITSDARQSKDQDTFFLRASICTYGCKEIKLEIASDAQNFQEMKLKKSKDIFISELNTWKIVSGLPRFSLYLRTTCLDSFQNSIVYLDTLTFKRSGN